MRWLRAWLPLLLAASVVALIGGALLGPHHFCRMARRVVTHCCCASASERPAGLPSVGRAGCCERLEKTPVVAVGQAPRAIDGLSQAALVALFPEVEPPSRVARVETRLVESARGPPAQRRLFARNCVFLI